MFYTNSKKKQRALQVLTPAHIYKKLFTLLTCYTDNDKAIVEHIAANAEVLKEAKPIIDIWREHKLNTDMFADILVSNTHPYLDNTGSDFIEAMNYFHLAAASLCSPVVLDALRTHMNIDINSNPMLRMRRTVFRETNEIKDFDFSPSYVGITGIFLYNNERNQEYFQQEIIPSVKAIFNYLGEQGYDFQNERETQLLSYYQTNSGYCGPEIKGLAEHIEVLIEKQKISRGMKNINILPKENNLNQKTSVSKI